MYFIAANVTAVALVAHALLGCCWHHAHLERTAATAAEHATLTPVVHGDHVHWHDGSHDEGDSNHDGHRHDGQPSGCGEIECTYAGGDPRVQIQSPLVGVGAPVIAPAHSRAGGQRDAASLTPFASERPPEAPLHLLYQVLII